MNEELIALGQKDFEEYIQSLSELRRAMHELHKQSSKTKGAVEKVLKSSHLQSVLTMSKEDKFLNKITL